MGLHGIAIFVNGTVGVGKTTTADAMGEVLTAREVPHAVIDLDQIRQAWPAPSGDPFNHRLELTNLQSLASNYAAIGASTLILVGVIEQEAAIARYEEALAGFRLVIVRLTADEEIRKMRITARHAADPAGLEWHLRRTIELEQILDAGELEHVLIDNSYRTPSGTAYDVIAAAEVAQSASYYSQGNPRSGG